MLGVTARADGATPDYWRLVDAAARFETIGSIRALGYAAHISLGLYDTITADQLATAVAAIVDRPPLSLRFRAISTFEGTPLVLWLAPDPDSRLTALHARLHALIGAERSAAHYRPGDWVPHCTLATRIDPALRDAALAFAHTPIEPVEMVFDRIEVVEFPPVRVISSTRM